MTNVIDQPTAGRTRRRWPWAVAAAAITLAVVVVVWFEPQKLFIDERVDEALPTAGREPSTGVGDREAPEPAASPDAATDAPAGPIDVARGEFVSLDHGTSGVVRILDLGDGTRVVRLEGLDTDNGPDLYLYLSPNPASGDEAAFDDGHVNLGRLKGNLGDQNYDLPAGIDLTRYRSAVIWCDRFNSAFGAADLAVQ